jgi:hypothetical protein
VNEINPIESIQMNETNSNPNHFIYYPNIGELETLPSYSQVMNDIFYLDLLTREQHNDELDGEC